MGGQKEVDDRLERMEEGRGMNMIVRLIETFREAIPILIIAYHPLSGCQISYD